MTRVIYIMFLLGKVHYLRDGGPHHAVGGWVERRILDASQRGGAKIFGQAAKGGENFWTWSIFFNVPKTQFFHVLWVFWALLIFWS